MCFAMAVLGQGGGMEKRDTPRVTRTRGPSDFFLFHYLPGRRGGDGICHSLLRIKESACGTRLPC